MNYTKEQEQAIFLRDKNIMVSAGAGAGKTRVLVSRMAELIMDEKNPVEADRFLVMTFTNAAAAEMKERISLDLEERLAKDPENHYLRKQIRKIRQADISTVHSFCNHLIRTHYNELSIDPSFRIGEEGELFLLRQQAIEQLLEEAYASGRESFVKFAESYAPGKSDKVLEELVGDLYRFSRSFPNASFWFEKTKQEALQLAEAKEWDNSPAVMLIFLKAKKELLQEKEALSKLLKNIAGEEVPEKYGVLLQDVSEYVEALSQTESYNAYYMVLSRGSVPAFPRATKKDKEWADYEIVKEWHQEVKELLQKQKETVFTAPAEELQREAAGIYPLLEEYIVLAQRFEEIYLAYKKEKNVYDFDDLEHFALELLVDHYDEGGQAYPSETAKTLAKKYKMIFVDEYQDTNLVQETILEMLSEKDNNTLFTVGDVKQSIYRFRQARPDLFLRRNEKYHNEEEGVSIELRDNFRSAPGVLCFTNYVFSRLMERDFGGVDYNEETALRAGEGGPMLEDKETSELLFFVKDSVQTLEEAPEDVLTETALITKRIQELIEEGYHYGDIVILLRSGAGRMEPMAEFLEKNGIPVSCENKTGYFHTREITIILNYLSVVDNVYQDIPMASVMLSSIGGFTEEELTKLRILVREPMREQYTLYDLMCLYLQEGAEEELRAKIQHFYKDLQYFREQKKEQPLGVLLWDIYQRTGFYYDVQLMPDGAKRKGAQARRRERMLFGITMFFACVLLFYRPRETFSITALDVGQGDALVVESGRFLMLNDGGSSSASAIGEKRILPYLKQRGIAALDAVVVTHPDADHTNGILELLELIGEQKTALRIRHLFLPVWMKGSEKENPFILAAQKAGIMVEYLKKGDEICAGELTVSVLHPGAGEDYTGEENAGSVVLQLSCGACRALLTGDLEGSGEEEVLGAAERCQILKVAHHGSRNSTSEAFLNRIQPQISLISCAWPGRYGHPHRELLERLRACKSHIYGTPVDGAVTVQLKRDRLAVHGYRSDVEFPVS